MKQKNKVSPSISQPTNSPNVSEPSHGGFFEEFTTLGTFLDGSAEVSTIGEVHDQAQPTGTDEDLSSVGCSEGWLIPYRTIKDEMRRWYIYLYIKFVGYWWSSVLVDVFFSVVVVL